MARLQGQRGGRGLIIIILLVVLVLLAVYFAWLGPTYNLWPYASLILTAPGL
ncbi:MAG: hypothetical protein M3281_03330 [Chloroflexota bacterium]|nr:hypothetical protein [Chloroflexota bacterium]